MSVVMVVIGLIMLTVFPALTAVRMSSQRSATQTNLQALMRATAAYVQANGCMPCPTPATTSGNGFGIVRGDTAATPAACGTCANAEGIPPYASLGIPASSAHDGWGNWVTMRVDTALTGAAANFTVIVPPIAPCQCSDFTTASLPAGCSAAQAGPSVTPSCTTLNASQKGICKASLSSTNRISVITPSGGTQKAAVIFVSHGSNGFGSYVASPTATFTNGCRIPFPGSNGCLPTYSCSVTTGIGAAQCNSSNTLQFADAPAVISGTNGYDDVLAYADRNSLISMFGNGSCQTVW